jgi:uncharacterized protein (TIGR00369 family)
MLPSDLQELLDAAPVHRALQLHASQSDAGELILRAQAGPDHAGADDSDFLHGGVVATVLDTTATFALIAATGVDWSTVDLRVDFLRPAPAGPLEARGRATHIGRRLGRATAELYAAGSQRLLASATGTFVRAANEAGADT